ncbi:MAG: leucine-rich repeat protein [Lachnospiraceae bacterium]|nr:leucine-rich repeat protein [Lachnospiraceae bacterium]
MDDVEGKWSIKADTVWIEADLEDYALAEHRELVEARLSKVVAKLGGHAFYNCRNLKRLFLWDTLQEMGDGAFKNCGKLSELVIVQSGKGSCAALKSILSELSGEFFISFVKEEPDKTWQSVVRNQIYIPSYLHDYEENTEARIINQVTYGAGVHYRECIREAGVDYAAYDRLFARCIPLDTDAAWKVAFFRCVYPWELHREAEKQYRIYLQENRNEIGKRLCKESITWMRLWLSLQPYQTEEEWKEAIDSLQEAEHWAATGLLLKELQTWRKEQGNDRKRTKKFEF